MSLRKEQFNPRDAGKKIAALPDTERARILEVRREARQRLYEKRLDLLTSPTQNGEEPLIDRTAGDVRIDLQGEVSSPKADPVIMSVNSDGNENPTDTLPSGTTSSDEIKQRIKDAKKRQNELLAKYLTAEGKFQGLKHEWTKDMRGLIFDIGLGDRFFNWWYGVDKASADSIVAGLEVGRLKDERDGLIRDEFAKTRAEFEEIDQKRKERDLMHQREDIVPVDHTFREKFGAEVADSVDYFNYVGREEEIGKEIDRKIVVSDGKVIVVPPEIAEDILRDQAAYKLESGKRAKKIKFWQKSADDSQCDTEPRAPGALVETDRVHFNLQIPGESGSALWKINTSDPSLPIPEKDPDAPSGFAIFSERLSAVGNVSSIVQMTNAECGDFLKKRAAVLAGKGQGQRLEQQFKIIVDDLANDPTPDMTKDGVKILNGSKKTVRNADLQMNQYPIYSYDPRRKNGLTLTEPQIVKAIRIAYCVVPVDEGTKQIVFDGDGFFTHDQYMARYAGAKRG